MESIWCLAIAVLEAREITIRFLGSAKETKPDSRLGGGEETINWRLLVVDTVQPEIAHQSVSDNTAAACKLDQAQNANNLFRKLRGQLVRRTLRLVSPLAKGRPGKRGALQKKDGSEGGRKECSASVTRGSCA